MHRMRSKDVTRRKWGDGVRLVMQLGGLFLLLTACNGAESLDGVAGGEMAGDEARESIGGGVREGAAVATGDLRLSYAMPEAKGEKVRYRVYLPFGWSADRQWPMVLVLHGYGGTADSPFDDADGALQHEAERHGFVVVSPNGYNGMADYGANLPLPSALSRAGKAPAMTPQEESALAEADVRNVLGKAIADYKIDPRRMYLMGNSMGMTGVLHFARTEPERWCAISASGGPPWPDYPVERLKPISGVLLVHGGRDDRARASDTQALAQRMKAAGIDARMELIPEGTHGDAWIRYLPQTLDFFASHKCANKAEQNG